MKKLSFPTVKLGNFICEVKEKVKNSGISQDDFTVYGVTNTDGITVTNNKASDDLGNYTVLRENQFAYNPYRVNVGSIGLSLPGTFGAVSPAYVVFETNGQISNEFLLYYLKSSLGINLIKWYGDRGGVRSALRFSDLKKIDFPDITLEQQNKLLIKIKKLDELLCELYKNLSDDKIEILRQSILQQAVEGKLCEQDPNDEPASVLLEKIKAEKERLIAEKKIKKQKPLPPITEDEKLFVLPKGWEWCRVGALCESSLGKMLDKKKNKGQLRPYLRNLNVQWFKFNLSDVLEMRFTDEEKDRYTVKYGDVVICEGGYPGMGAIWENTENIYFQKALHRNRFFFEGMNYYFLYYLYSIFYNGKLKKYYTGMGIQHLTGKSLANIPIPVPPLAELQRIVKKVEILFQLLDKLEQEISNVKLYASDLIEAVLQEAFSVQEAAKPAQVIEFHPDQTTPETELLAAARGKIREDTWEHLRKRALEIANEES